MTGGTSETLAGNARECHPRHGRAGDSGRATDRRHLRGDAGILIEVMPGALSGKLSSEVAMRLVVVAPSHARLAFRPGSLQRVARETSEQCKRPGL